MSKGVICEEYQNAEISNALFGMVYGIVSYFCRNFFDIHEKDPWHHDISGVIFHRYGIPFKLARIFLQKPKQIPENLLPSELFGEEVYYTSALDQFGRWILFSWS